MQYVKQRDRFRCGPVALLNALKWQGLRISLTGLRDLSELVQCKWKNSIKHSGTYLHHFNRVAKQLGYVRLACPSVTKIDRELKAGNIVILLRIAKDFSWGHYSIVIDHKRGRYYGVNHTGNTHGWYPRKTFYRRHFGTFEAWVVRPLKVGKLIYKPKSQ